MTETSHRASIAIARIKADGHIPDTVEALLDRIEELEAEHDEIDLELAQLRHIKEIAAGAIGSKAWGYDATLSEAQRAIEIVVTLAETLAETPEQTSHG